MAVVDHGHSVDDVDDQHILRYNQSFSLVSVRTSSCPFYHCILWSIREISDLPKQRTAMIFLEGYRLIGFTVFVFLFIASRFPRRLSRWQNFIDNPIWKSWCQYFSFRVVRVGENQDYLEAPNLFAEYPHGVFPLGYMLGATTIRDIFPNAPPIDGAVATILFRVPFIRQLVAWFGGV